MSVKLSNHARWIKKTKDYDWYDWEVFVDETEEKLDEIDHIVYFLHQTFPDPVRTIVDKGSGFALKSRGWGEFDLKARVVYKDGKVEHVTYPLDLSKG